jgi:protein TonB
MPFIILSQENIVKNENSLPQRNEESPFFRECRRSDKRTNECFTKQFLKHFKRRFNAELPYKLDLPSGKKSIFIKLRINKEGKIDSIQVNAPHPKVEQEVLRVLRKFPRLNPGKLNGVPVPVKYQIPIYLFVEESKSERKARRKREKLEKRSKD